MSEVLERQYSRPRPMAEECSFPAEEMGQAAYMARRGGNKMLKLRDYPRLAGYFGLEHERFEQKEKTIHDEDGNPITILVNGRRFVEADFRDMDGVEHVVCVINAATYRELVTLPPSEVRNQELIAMYGPDWATRHD